MVATTSSPKSITVSIVSHGQQALILPLLEQLERHCGTVIERVVLTVNIPEPMDYINSVRSISLVCVTNPEPRGFGANHNAAFRHCSTPWFLVLNPDIRIDSDIPGALTALAQNHDGLLAPRVIEPDKAKPEPHRGLITPWEILARNRPNYQAPRQPTWIPGMFMLLRSAAYQQIHGFDERFFMYGEDFDICARLRLAGWSIHMADHLQVRHEAQRASRRDWRHRQWHLVSLLHVWSSRAFWRYRALQSGR